jgi:hypothetical protein
VFRAMNAIVHSAEAVCEVPMRQTNLAWKHNETWLRVVQHENVYVSCTASVDEGLRCVPPEPGTDLVERGENDDSSQTDISSNMCSAGFAVTSNFERLLCTCACM